MSARSAKACAPPGLCARRCSSPPRSGRTIWRRASSSAPPGTASAKLRLSEVDLLLIHWPNPRIPLADTIGALCRMKREGLTRHIGISNFTVDLVAKAVKLATEPLVTNQIEWHPYIDQSKVVEACRRDGLSVTAYSPIARGRAVDDDTLRAIGLRHRKSAGQVCLRFLVQRGRDRHSPHLQARAPRGEPGDFRFRACAGRDGGDPRSRQSAWTDRELVGLAQLGLMFLLPRPAIEIGCCRSRSSFKCRNRVDPTSVGESVGVRGSLHRLKLAGRPPHPDRAKCAIRPLPAGGERWYARPRSNAIALGSGWAPYCAG